MRSSILSWLGEKRDWPISRQFGGGIGYRCGYVKKPSSLRTSTSDWCISWQFRWHRICWPDATDGISALTQDDGSIDLQNTGAT